jgi:hypothetical protein
MPVGIHVLAELLAGLDLPTKLVDAVGRHVARPRATVDDADDAGVRAVPGVVAIGAPTARLVAA